MVNSIDFDTIWYKLPKIKPVTKAETTMPLPEPKISSHEKWQARSDSYYGSKLEFETNNKDSAVDFALAQIGIAGAGKIQCIIDNVVYYTINEYEEN